MKLMVERCGNNKEEVSDTVDNTIAITDIENYYIPVCSEAEHLEKIVEVIQYSDWVLLFRL